jgi:lipopolysaccharide/colanic/teichoic acid biosynthesis glycosyltransferase
MYRHRLKRVLDRAFALGALILLAPLLGVIYALVRINLGSPVLFKQERPGLNGNAFLLLKFRTMADVRANDGRQASDEARLIPLGRFLRRTSLDELPELWNILKGDMSLVGPRPLLIEYLPLYSSEQARRHDVRPGMTGWAQVNGRNALSWEEKFKLDVWYVDNLSLKLDLQILLWSMAIVLSQKGVSAESHATMPTFTGSER